MDFLDSVFRSAFSGYDFSVIGFWLVLFTLCLLLATLLLCICTNVSDGVKTPRWGKVLTVCVGLAIALLTGVAYVTS